MQSLDSLRTARLLLSRPREADFDELARMFADPKVGATLGGVRSRNQARVLFDRYVEHWERHDFGLWVMRDPDTGTYIGRGGLRIWEIDGREEIEVGYALMPEYWGRGLATELARESVCIGFTVLGRPELISFTLPTNWASRRVMEKAGFLYERDGVYADLPHVFYRLTRERWRELQGAAGG